MSKEGRGGAAVPGLCPFLVNKCPLSWGLDVVPAQEMLCVAKSGHQLSTHPHFKPSSSSFLTPKVPWIRISEAFMAEAGKIPLT